ncbi:hypothetical protein CULT_720042 [[Clostridium] ultunense Esp]|nr:hypothetical protein CULT_720042 [[Clostridium] ultunense Esp]
MPSPYLPVDFVHKLILPEKGGGGTCVLCHPAERLILHQLYGLNFYTICFTLIFLWYNLNSFYNKSEYKRYFSETGKAVYEMNRSISSAKFKMARVSNFIQFAVHEDQT